MKKRLAYLFLALTLVVLALYLFRYKRALVIESKIPITATEVVQIDLRQIEHHLLVDALKNPFKYISFETKKKEDHASFKKAIVIPRNILFFTNDSNFKSAWFSSFFKLKDRTELENYLLQQGFKTLTDEALELFGKGNIVVAISSENVLIAYKKQSHAPVNAVIQSIFNETEFYKKDVDLLKPILNSKSDITYVSSKDAFLEADFKNGLFEIKGKLHSNLFLADSYVPYSEGALAFLSTKINRNHAIFKSLLTNKNKTKFREFTKLSMDSIVNHWNGHLLFNLKAINKEIDTIVTYEYDDDFNKIEKKSVQENNVPHTAIALGSDAKLFEYFYTNNAIQVVENDTLFTAMPLYKMYAQKQKKSLTIFTQKLFDSSMLKAEKYKLNAHMDINRYLENPLEFSLIPVKNNYLQLLGRTSAKLTTNDELLIQVWLKESNRNFLGQFIKP
ncbi:hypothetical protein [Flavivirga eckloniae]|uniref:DUF3352 domain-containing protein n=1 Tax=Flavivirga eckloniae TaxID=1803846 RepID=A0A2K9PK04_9FLAO|nr:hypothetical protein [Flavivirga eckloniae]AUP77365.1 hypothetical protein C1H87_00970 [Flavivirga eckloniae]